MDIQKKKELLFRRNKGKRIERAYLKKIGSIYEGSLPLEFLDLNKTDTIRENAWNSTSLFSEKKIKATKENTYQLIQEIKDLFSGDSFYIYIDDDWKYCGAFGVGSLDGIKDDFYFDLIKDDIVFVNEKLFIMLDFHSEKSDFFIDCSVRTV
jgi:hypothetical protein